MLDRDGILPPRTDQSRQFRQMNQVIESSSTHPNDGVGTGPGPLRHPRPLATASLHLELEKEQEAIINRLARELSLLRQQTASTVSNSSSIASNHGATPSYAHDLELLGKPSQRHRSSSSLSGRSLASVTGATQGAAIAPARESAYAWTPRTSIPFHTERSQTSASGCSTVAGTGSGISEAQVFGAGPRGRPRSSLGSTTGINSARVDEVAEKRAEWEKSRRENENLRVRIMELEAQLASGRVGNRSASEGR